MDTTRLSQRTMQVTENIVPICSKTRAELSARNYSDEYHQRVIKRFVATQNIRQTARDFAIPARVVNEILHLADLRRRVAGAA